MSLFPKCKFLPVAFLVLWLKYAESKPRDPISKVVDLSHAFDNFTVYWPTERANRFKFTNRVAVKTKDYYYEANSFSAAEHGGTHIDAPRHFFRGGHDVATIPLDQIVGKAIVINVESKTSKNPDYLISVQDFEAWESKEGTIESKTIVLLNTGWGKKWPNLTEYLGTASTNVSLLHFPGLSEAGADWLTEKRKVKAVGIDTASIDNGQSSTYRTHQALSSKNVPVFENVANVHLLPSKGFVVVALPMKISEGSGAPLRMVAVFGDFISAGDTLQKCIVLPIFSALLTVLFQMLR